MARFAYDVNTTERYIDVHKQFQGGLKTVDTDDALGAVFLREAENVSISEFGFLEKRYGTFENFKQTFSGNLQGYWEFEGYKIFAVDGDIFVNDINNRVVEFLEEAGLRYPTNDNIPFNVDPVFTTTTTCAFSDSGAIFASGIDISTNPTCGAGVEKIVCTEFGEGFFCQLQVGELTTTSTQTAVTIVDHFQAERDMNAVNINRVLYIFTGTYPVYANVEEGVLKFYLFPVTIPTFDEIVVTGHNLLEDDYEGLYFSNTTTISEGSSIAILSDSPVITQSAVSPRFPFETGEGNDLKFHFRTTFPQDMSVFSKQGSSNYYEVNLDSVSFRSSGSGASVLDFLEVDIEKTDFKTKSNYPKVGNYDPITDDLSTRGNELLSFVPFSVTDVKSILINLLGRRRFEYRITNNFEISRVDFLKNNKYLIELFRFDGVNFSNFILHNVAPGALSIFERTTLKITPVDFNDNILKKESVNIIITNRQLEQPDYSFEIPSNLNKNITIKKYIFEFTATGIENADVVPGPLGPEDMETNPENYFFNVVSIDNKAPVVSPNILGIDVVPDLSFTLPNLINGNFDFKVRFVREEWRRVLNDGQFLRLELLNKEFFETIISNVRITAEQLQDFPRKDEDSIGIEYPTLKPIWTCNKVTEHFGKLMVWGSTDMPTALFYSFPDRPTYFPSKFFLDFTNDQNSPVEAVSSYMNILVVLTQDQLFGVRGNSGLLTAPAPYAPFTINSTVGTIAYKSVRAVRNQLFFLSKQGIIALKSLFATDEQYNIDFVDRNILNIVPRTDPRAVGIQFDNQYWLNFPEERITLRWYIDKKAWVQDKYSVWQEFNGVFKYQIADGKLEFITYPSLFDGENLGVYKVGVDYSLPTDLGGDIIALFETAFLNQNYPFHPKNYKETKMDFTIQNEYNLGREPVYTMETNEDINENQDLHTLVSPNLTKNHRYQLKYEAYIIDGGALDTDFTNLKKADGGGFIHFTLTRVIDAMETYTLDTGAISLQSTIIDFEETSENTYEFLLANSVPIGQDLTIIREFTGYSGGASLLDITYDHVLDFRTWIISEDNTLNLENFEGYDQSKALIPIQMGAKFGDWVFGQSDLGNKVTAVKTIKLSGRGYNVKIYFEDYSKSKWTLESLGITYKMRRPRSR